MTKKKTLYQVLEVSATASEAEIREAYRARLKQLLEQQAGMSVEDFDYQRKLLNLAQETLADALSRQAYDEKLMSRALPSSAERRNASLALVPQEDPEAVARKAETIALRAEALALRMEATSLRAVSALPQEEVRPASLLQRGLSLFSGPLARVAVAVATIAVLMIAMQMSSFFFTVRKVDAVNAAASKAQERAEMQEYYQTNGVRAASVAEARMLEEERQRKRAQENSEERERTRLEQEEKRFLEESRREAERVSANLRASEEQMKREAEWARRQKEQEEQRREAEERERVREAQARIRNLARD